jgi:hypothetical protein
MWLRKAWRYQRDNKKSQNLRMTDNTMTNRKIQKDKQWSTKHYSENKWTTQTSLKRGVYPGDPRATQTSLKRGVYPGDPRATQTSLKRGCIQVILEQHKHH